MKVNAKGVAAGIEKTKIVDLKICVFVRKLQKHERRFKAKNYTF